MTIWSPPNVSTQNSSSAAQSRSCDTSLLMNAALRIQVRYDDFASFLGEAPRDPLAKPLSAAGHNRYLVFQSHLNLIAYPSTVRGKRRASISTPTLAPAQN